MGWMIPAAMMASSVLPSLFGHKSSTWSGEKSKIHKLPTLNSYQQRTLKDILKHPERQLPMMEDQPLYQQGSGYLQSILSQDPEMMKQFEAPAMRQFNEEIVPGIAERFSGAGARSSSAFNQAMGQAGSGLAERIAAMRAQLGLGAAGQALNYAQMPFAQNMARLSLGLGTPAFGYQATGGTPGMGSGISNALLQGGGSAMGMMGMMSALGGMGGGGAPVRSASWGSGFPGMS